ncbi:MAG: CNNM domain-containing protein, partial [Planctomycetota bacterium]
MLIEVVVILALVLANGIFSGAEMAIVASRRGRLRTMADAGDAAAKAALDLASNPDRFLPTVQVGVTLVGTLAAAYGGERIVDALAAWLAATWPALAGVAHPAALAAF